MIERIAYAIAIGLVAALLCLLGGTILGSLNVPVVEAIAKFLTQWAWVIGFIVGVLTFVRNPTWPWGRGA